VSSGAGHPVASSQPVPCPSQRMHATGLWAARTHQVHSSDTHHLSLTPSDGAHWCSLRYEGRLDFGLSDINVGIDMGTRVAIVGPNGAGKSTLLNLLSGDLTPTEGINRRSQKLRIGRYSQHFVDILQMDETPVSYLLSQFPTLGMAATEMRAMLGAPFPPPPSTVQGPPSPSVPAMCLPGERLTAHCLISLSRGLGRTAGKFGLPGFNHLTPIVKLSGGQKARVVLAAISLSQPHILLLDEPTNNLDMQSIDALAEALDAFTGGVVLVRCPTLLTQTQT
jgi:ATP-binding cassette subfamily F protein 1